MCNIVGDIIKCHASCKTCFTNSNCGLENACTSCFPGDYKISSNFNDLIFKCSKECNGDYLQHDDYYFCDGNTVQNILQFGISKTNSIATSESNQGLVIIICLIIGFIFLFFVFKIIQNIKYKKKSLAPTINADVEQNPQCIEMLLMNNSKPVRKNFVFCVF